MSICGYLKCTTEDFLTSTSSSLHRLILSSTHVEVRTPSVLQCRSEESSDLPSNVGLYIWAQTPVLQHTLSRAPKE